MRTATAPELAVLASLTRSVTWRVKVANGSGTMIDLSSWVEDVSPDTDVDQPVAGATIDFTRANGVLQTLSPLRTDSTLNVKDDLTYAPLVDLVRAVTIEAAVTASGVLPGAGDFKLMLEGTTATVNFASNPITVECRDKGGQIVDRWVEAKKLYGSTPGVAVQTVMQEILDDTFGAGVVPLYTPVSPGYLISPAFQQQIQSVMDAQVALAQNPGWDVRYKWDNGTSAFRFTLSEPPRTKTVPDHTFGPSDYFDIMTLELSEVDIRNAIIVEYKDSVDNGNRTTVIVSDGPSITKYRRRPLLITEGDSSPINTSAEATTLANSSLADLKDPKADKEVVMPLFWPVEIGDLYRFTANGVHYNNDLDLAVVGFTHGLHETRLRLRGNPAGQYMTWLARGEAIGGGTGAGAVAKAPYPYISPLNTEANDLTWDLRFNAVLGSGGGGANLTYTINLKKSFASVTLLDSGNASVFPLTLTVTRDPKQNAVLVFAVTDAATGLTREVTYPIPSYNPYINSAGDTITSGTYESGGRAINRLYAKPLPGDPDHADSVGSGVVRRIPLVGAMDGPGNIDLGGTAWVNKNGFYLPRNAGSSVPISTVTDYLGDSGHATAGFQESGGKLINRLFAKPLAADPDDLDSVGNGTTYSRPLATRISSGKPLIDFSEGINLNKYSEYIGRSAADSTAVSTIIQNVGNTGHAASGMQESGGKAINRLFAKPLAADADNLDNLPDGASYARPLSTRISAGKPFIDLSEAINLNRTLTYISDAGSRFAAIEANANNTESRTSADTSAVAGTAAATVQSGAARGQGGFSNSSGALVTGATESGGKAVNRVFAKPLAGDPDTFDSVGDGTTYKRVTGVSSGLVQTASIATASVTKTKVEGRFRCRVFKNGSNQTVGASATITWDGEYYDVGDLHDNATNNNRITVPAGGDTGVWMLYGQIGWDANATGYRDVEVRKDGSTILGTSRILSFSASSLGPVQQFLAIDDAPAVGAYYEVIAFQGSGADRTVTASESFFAATHSW